MTVRRLPAQRWSVESARATFKPGESWTYDGPESRDYLEAKVQSVDPEQKPTRLRVILFDHGFEVERKLVPPSRMRARWEHVDAMRAEDALWDRVRYDRPGSTAEAEIAWVALDLDAWFDYREYLNGVGVILDAASLAAHLSMSVEQFEDPLGFDLPEGRVVGWGVVKRMAVAALERNGSAQARREIAKLNAFRNDHRELVAERLATKHFDYELRALPNDHPVFDSRSEVADRIEAGLDALIPGRLVAQLEHDARDVLVEAVLLLMRVRPELIKTGQTKKQRALLTEVNALLERVTMLDREMAGASERVLESAESPQEHPSTAVSHNDHMTQIPPNDRGVSDSQLLTDQSQSFRFNV